MPMMPENIQTFPSSTLTLASEARVTPLDDIEAIVATYQQRVFRFLLLTLRDRDAAETLTQETFLRAWNARASFRSDCSISSWLIRIALNLARDHTRTGRFRFWKHIGANAVDVAEVAASIPDHQSSAESHLLARERVAQIWTTVAGLSVRQRSIFLLRFVEEMDIHEIAEATGLPIGTVKSHLYRALAVIRKRHNPTQTETT
jgi:RNA polymerase sigma-70 factor (ECF subfamily)